MIEFALLLCYLSVLSAIAFVPIGVCGVVWDWWYARMPQVAEGGLIPDAAFLPVGGVRFLDGKRVRVWIAFWFPIQREFLEWHLGIKTTKLAVPCLLFTWSDGRWQRDIWYLECDLMMKALGRG